MTLPEHDTPGPYGTWARSYFDLGWRGVLPLPARCKAPVPTGYTGRSGADPSYADLYAWTEAHPAGNIALRLPRGVLGLDIDAYGDKTGAATIMAAIEQWGPLPASWRSSARSDQISGIRLYRVPEGLRWPGELPGGGVEVIQYVHRYAVVAPSINPDTGTVYRWYDPDGVATLAYPGPDQLPWLPDTWIQGLTGGQEDTAVAKLDVDVVSGMGWLVERPGWADDPCPVLTRDLAEYQQPHTGSEHDHTMRMLLRVVRHIEGQHPGGASVLADVHKTFLDRVTAAGRSGARTADDAQREWNRLLTGAIGLVQADPGPATCDCYGQLSRALVGLVEAPPWEQPTPPGPEVPPEATSAPLPDAELPPGVITPLDWSELFGDEREESWVSFPILPERRQVLIHSQPKVGKSLLMLELAVAVANGRPFLGHATLRRRVLYVDFENDPRGDVRSRLEDMAVGPDELGDLVYLSYPDLAALNTPAGARQLLDNALHHSCPVVVIDTISRAIHGEENSNDTWLSLYQSTGLAMKRHGISMIRLDHSGKDDTKGARGGSAKNGDVDAVWSLTRVSPETYQLKATHKRFQLDEEQGTVTFERRDDPLRSVAVGGSVAGFGAKVTQCQADLDGLGVPPTAGRPACRTALKEAGFRHKTAVIEAAVRERKTALLVPVDNSSGAAPGAGAVAFRNQSYAATTAPGAGAALNGSDQGEHLNCPQLPPTAPGAGADCPLSLPPYVVEGGGQAGQGAAIDDGPSGGPIEDQSDCNGCGKRTYDAVLSHGKGYCLVCTRERGQA